MKYLVCETVMESGQKVIITWSDGSTSKAVYNDTYGYNHMFTDENGKQVRLSNHFMHLKGITVEKDKTE